MSATKRRAACAARRPLGSGSTRRISLAHRAVRLGLEEARSAWRRGVSLSAVSRAPCRSAPGRRVGRGDMGRPRDRGSDHRAPECPGPASRFGPADAGRAHRLFSDGRNGSRSVCRARTVGQGEGCRISLLPARRGADPDQRAGPGQARPRQPDRRPPGAVYPRGSRGGHSRAAASASAMRCVQPRTP